MRGISSHYITGIYRKAFADLREASATILVTVTVFLICIFIGMANPALSQHSLSAMRDLAEELTGASIHVLILTIFLKNAISTLISVGTGVFFGLVSLTGAVVNGLLMGSTLSYIKEVNRPHAIMYLFPHGLFEFPAMFMAWGLGLWQGTWFFQKTHVKSYRERMRSAFMILCIIILPLLLIAAMIEGASIYCRMQ